MYLLYLGPTSGNLTMDSLLAQPTFTWPAGNLAQPAFSAAMYPGNVAQTAPFALGGPFPCNPTVPFPPLLPAPSMWCPFIPPLPVPLPPLPAFLTPAFLPQIGSQGILIQT